MSLPNLTSTNQLRDEVPATPPSAGQKRGPVARRRFQKGSFVIEADGRMYSMHYVDADGKSKRMKRFLGSIARMSERAARREHARIMEEVNRKRVNLARVFRGQTFTDAVNKWRKAIAPNLSPATVRQRESYLRFTSFLGLESHPYRSWGLRRYSNSQPTSARNFQLRQS